LKQLTNEEGWLLYEIAFKDKHSGRVINSDNRFPGEMLIPSEKCNFGVISDIDDTILNTGVTSFLKLKLLFNTFFRNVRKRSPLEGASQFYRQLHRGVSGNDANPMFYVSHSPWNLYRYLELFLKANDFPKGPVLLRDFPSPFRKKETAEKPQKQKEIIDLLNTYPEMSFILIGDSGEHDADIYIEIAEAFPDRIKAIYLRSVKHEKKMIRIRSLFNDYDTVPVLLVEDSKLAVEHAREHGFIS
jgi:phosphatidate phosphatase APP1